MNYPERKTRRRPWPVYLFCTLLILAYGRLSAQPCAPGCVVNSLNLSTMMSATYDPIWKVPGGAPAYSITPHSAWGAGDWISSLPTAWCFVNGIYPFQTCFCLCDTDTVTFNFTFMADDAAEIYVDATLIAPYGGGFNSPTSVNQTMILGPGKHCLNINVKNINSFAMGLSVSGTVSGNKLLSRTCCDPKGNICGVKYEDVDHNGVRDEMDPVIPGWKFYIYDHYGHILDSAVTDAQGRYCFINVDPAFYYVYEEQVAGWSPIYPEDYHTFNLQSGQTMDGDFGNYHGTKSNRICGYKYHDVNCNGVRDSLPTLEPGIEWWEISIYDSASRQTINLYTDSLGRYCSENLFDGTYTVYEEQVTNWTQSAPGGSGTYQFHLSGNSQVTATFGNCMDTIGRICGLKWEDLNRDGIRQGNEPVIEGWPIYLNGPVNKTAVTGPDGKYCFEKLGPGTYTVSEYQSIYWLQIYPNNPKYHTVVLAFNQEALNKNFGNSFGHNVGDGDGDGSGCFPDTLKINTGYDHNSHSVYGTEVYDAFWEVTQAPISGLSLPMPASTLNENFSTAGWGSTLPSSRWISLHATSEMAVVNGLSQTPYRYQTCFCHALSDSIRLKFDVMADDVFDIYIDSILIKSDRAGGHFSPGSALHIDTTIYLKRGYHCMKIDVWNVGGILHGLDVSGNLIGAGVMEHKCCYTKSSICGVKYSDEDGNGQRQLVLTVAEKLLKNWKMYLKDDNGNIIDSTLTDTLGQYCFRNLGLGYYHVEEESQVGWRKISPLSDEYDVNLGLNQVSQATFGNLYDTTCFIHDTLRLNTGYNYGSNQLDATGDLDGGWVLDSSPDNYPMHSPVLVNSYVSWQPAQSNSSWISHTTQTAQTAAPLGWYNYRRCFCLKNNFGTVKLVLRVRADDSAQVLVNGVAVGTIAPGSATAGSPVTLTITNAALFHNGENCITIKVRNTTGVTGLNVSAEVITAPNTSAQRCCGIPGKGSISGYKWNDLNQDGIRQSNEPLIPNWMIGIYGDLPVFTDANGYYIIPNLEANSYTVMELDSPNWKQSYPFNDGSYWGGSQFIDLPEGIHMPFVNFGNYLDEENASISGIKWEDLNQDGIKQPGEPVLANWGFVLSNGDTVYTDVNGVFLFDSLASDTYDLSEIHQTNWYQSYPSGPKYTIRLFGGSDTTGYNFGNYRRCFKKKSVSLAGATAATDWQITVDPDFMTMEPRPSMPVFPKPLIWSAAMPGTSWLGTNPSGTASVFGTYEFTHCFCLKAGAMNPTLNLQLRADDWAQVYLNGFLIGATPNPGYNTALPTTISTSTPTYFLPGLNCITIKVHHLLGSNMGMNVSGSVTTLDSSMADHCCGVLSQVGGGEFKLAPKAPYTGDMITPRTIEKVQSTGIDEKGKVSNLLIYPNPSDNMFNLRYTGQIAEGTMVQVYDMLGRLIMQVPLKDQLQLNLSGHKPGIYTLSISGTQQQQTRKLILK